MGVADRAFAAPAGRSPDFQSLMQAVWWRMPPGIPGGARAATVAQPGRKTTKMLLTLYLTRKRAGFLPAWCSVLWMGEVLQKVVRGSRSEVSGVI